MNFPQDSKYKIIQRYKNSSERIFKEKTILSMTIVKRVFILQQSKAWSPCLWKQYGGFFSQWSNYQTHVYIGSFQLLFS